MAHTAHTDVVFNSTAPTVIFFDHHEDPATYSILTHLLPDFKRLRYQGFFDEETPSSDPSENTAAHQKAKIEFLLATEFFGISKESKRRESRMRSIDFLAGLMRENLGYNRLDLRGRASGDDELSRILEAWYAANAVSTSGFGKLGLGHLKGFQAALRMLSLKGEELHPDYFLDMSKLVICVHVFSKDLDLSLDEASRQLERDAREGRLDLPFGLHHFDLRTRSLEDVRIAILELIRERQAYLHDLHAFQLRFRTGKPFKVLSDLQKADSIAAILITRIEALCPDFFERIGIKPTQAASPASGGAGGAKGAGGAASVVAAKTATVFIPAQVNFMIQDSLGRCTLKIKVPHHQLTDLLLLRNGSDRPIRYKQHGDEHTFIADLKWIKMLEDHGTLHRLASLLFCPATTLQGPLRTAELESSR